MPKKEYLAYLLIGCLSLGAGIGLNTFLAPKPQKTITPKYTLNKNPVGTLVSNLKLSTPLKKESSLYDHNNDYVLINFWATWCPPCRREIPILNKLHIENKNLTVLGFSYDKDYTVLEFQQKFSMRYPVFMNNHQVVQLNALFGNKSGGLPYSVLLNKDHKIIMVHAGEITENQILSLIPKKTS